MLAGSLTFEISCRPVSYEQARAEALDHSMVLAAHPEVDFAYLYGPLASGLAYYDLEVAVFLRPSLRTVSATATSSSPLRTGFRNRVLACQRTTLGWFTASIAA